MCPSTAELGLTAKQIAELLGVKTNAVEVALHRALGRLKALLDPSHPGVETPRPKITETQALDG
ncbi:MAG: RNA polymerase sigma factor [Gaiellaceae bacterium]